MRPSSDEEGPIALLPLATSSIGSSDNNGNLNSHIGLPEYQEQPEDDQNTLFAHDNEANYPTSPMLRSSSTPRQPIRTGRTPPPPSTPRIQPAQRRMPRRGTLKHSFYLLLERPTSSSAAFTVHLLSNSFIVLSALLTVLETLPFFHAVDSSLWFGLETAIVALFTVEYTARCFAWSENWSTWWSWFTSFFAIVDLLAILPYYIELVLRADTTVLFRFSILRTFRLLRVFRPFRYSSTILLTIEVMIVSVRRSQHALLALAFFLGMAVLVFSTLLYFAERGVWDETLETFVDDDGVKSRFESIPSAAWFVLVTITTVGYGEIIPRSFLGRLITVPLLLLGLLLVALPSFVLGREFAVVWEEMGGQLFEDIAQDLSFVHGEPESPHTPFTGRSVRSNRSNSNRTGELRSASATGAGGNAEPAATHRQKGKGREVVFDVDSDDESHPRHADERGKYAHPKKVHPSTIAASSSLPKHIQHIQNLERTRAESNAQTSAFMGIGTHRRASHSISHLPSISLDLGGSGGSESGSLLAGLAKEREALQKERAELQKERAQVANEREQLIRLIGSLGSLGSLRHPSDNASGGF